MNNEFVHCDDCVEPDGCLSRCYITEYLKENQNVAEQCGETPAQLWGDAE
jgi:hypothetical protein